MRSWTKAFLFTCFLFIYALSSSYAISQTADEIPNAIVDRINATLDGRWISDGPSRGSAPIQKGNRPERRSGDQTGGLFSLAELFEKTAPSVPLVIAAETTGSAVVISVDSAPRVAWVITNQHVVSKHFSLNGLPVVFLLFYNEKISGEFFDGRKFSSCIQGSSKGEWCRAVKVSFRPAVITAIDPGRDLALLAVQNPPSNTRGISQAQIRQIRTGYPVAVIGHPKGFLWSLTQGIVSGIRRKFRMGNAYGTVIQTQAPINPGNSGGPLLTPDGKLAGVIAWQIQLSQGLNAAVGINEVRSFYEEKIANLRNKTK